MGQQFGAPSSTQVAAVLTGGNGSWSYNAQPKIQTSYQASANGGTSTPAGGSKSHATAQRSQGRTGMDCVDVTWKAGQPGHVRPCHKAPATP